ncbi:MAG: DUF5060 domain-containing protein [Gemmatimonadota bacterium]|nr:MAG: DUF5060 domain-containing protein [Gemmatimonadota bacterium]
MRSRFTSVRYMLLAAVVVVGFLALLVVAPRVRAFLVNPDDVYEYVPPVAHAPVFNTTLRISFFGNRPSTLTPQRHVSVFVNGPHYSGMEDNDIRGFLDGTFRWGWNQPGQIHVRTGRRGRSLFWAEYELMRVLHRWDRIQLPPTARVMSAALILEVESEITVPRRLMLYEVKKDWNPGSGGTHNDNVSPPKQGEVWWNDIGFGEEPWGLPGVGFASDTHPNADTGEMPLAEAVAHTDDAIVRLTSPRLAAYVTRRVNAHEPLLFLLKLADYEEDTRGSVVELYSGNHGDSRNVSRRPRLVLEWESQTEMRSLEREIALEYGRSYSLEPLQAEGAGFVAVSSLAASDAERPTLQATRGAGEDETAATHQLLLPWDRIELTVVAAHDPVILGDAFEAGLKDTWVRTGSPEDQIVPWTFVAPSGRRVEIEARYEGDNRWGIEFYPDEIGPWEYYWTQNFTVFPYTSSLGHFDLLAGDEDNVRRQLALLAEEIEGGGAETPDRILALMDRLYGLERRAMQLLTPEEFQSQPGREIKELLNRVRAALDEPVPDTIPFQRSP